MREWRETFIQAAVARIPYPQRRFVDRVALNKAVDRILSPALLDGSVKVAIAGSGEPALAIATEVKAPGTGLRYGLLHQLTLSDVDPARCLEMLAQLRSEARKRNWRVLLAHLPPRTAEVLALFDPAWSEHASFMRKRLERPPEMPPGTAKIRLAVPEDMPFILDLTRQALGQGLSPVQRTLERTPDLEARALAVLRRTLENRPLALIADINGLPIGHALASLEERSELTGQTEVMVHDVFVIEEHRNTGVSRRLFRAVERVAAAKGACTLVSTVVTQSNELRRVLVDRLEADGWLLAEKQTHLSLL